ncbi:hypothetical protein H4219_001744 [Mycoemilia scoparia]|uniref:Uncharacterized protein n=1 Tax=Mycoemilia scoparia TaxID=417184 RepID=A0A9W8A8T7_9FUNG|nr:hypothetical protein H4219_001744 [Mycoemilia scoparia]
MSLECYTKAMKRDGYMAVAYLQRGITYVLLHKYFKALKMEIVPLDEAIKDFTKVLQVMGEREFIDYTQLGLHYALYRWEVLYNLGLCYYHKKMFGVAQKRMCEASLAVAINPTIISNHSLLIDNIAVNKINVLKSRLEHTKNKQERKNAEKHISELEHQHNLLSKVRNLQDKGNIIINKEDWIEVAKRKNGKVIMNI